MKVSTPRATIRRTDSVQRTRPVSWRASSSRSSSALVTGSAVALATTGMARSRSGAAARWGWKVSTAGHQRRVEGAADVQRHHPLGPSSLAAAGSRSRAVHSPDDDVPGGVVVGDGQHLVLGDRLDGHLDASADSPSTELIDPGRASAARCIASARLATSSSPASNDSAPAATRAENSPVPGHVRRPRDPGGLQRPRGRHRHAEDRRLGDVGLPQLVGAGRPQRLGQVPPRQALAHW